MQYFQPLKEWEFGKPVNRIGDSRAANDRQHKRQAGHSGLKSYQIQEYADKAQYPEMRVVYQGAESPKRSVSAAPARHAEIHEQSKGKVGRGRKKDIHIVCSGKVKILYEKSLGKHHEV